MLTVNEVFHSIQGESTHAGERCVFVRLTACDLRCSWCDTPYAFHEGRKRTVDDVLDELESRDEVNYVRTMLERGNGAERQLEVFEQTNDLKKVVEYMVAETAAGL